MNIVQFLHGVFPNVNFTNFLIIDLIATTAGKTAKQFV